LDLPALAGQAPPDETLVVFHTAVLAYVRDREDRAAFARSVAQLDAVWIANEGPQNIPGVPQDIQYERPPGDFLSASTGNPPRGPTGTEPGSTGAPPDVRTPIDQRTLLTAVCAVVLPAGARLSWGRFSGGLIQRRDRWELRNRWTTSTSPSG
jgi:hypothetical protein